MPQGSKVFSEIPPTVSENEKVTIFEALYDLDFIGNNEEAHRYEPVNISQQYNGTAKEMTNLLKKRSIDGKPLMKGGEVIRRMVKGGQTY